MFLPFFFTDAGSSWSASGFEDLDPGFFYLDPDYKTCRIQIRIRSELQDLKFFNFLAVFVDQKYDIFTLMSGEKSKYEFYEVKIWEDTVFRSGFGSGIFFFIVSRIWVFTEGRGLDPIFIECPGKTQPVAQPRVCGFIFRSSAARLQCHPDLHLTKLLFSDRLSKKSCPFIIQGLVK